MKNIRESLQQTARDLFNLEINTILKENMTARKMPDPANALLDIIHTYARKLIELKVPLDFFFSLQSEVDMEKKRPAAGWKSKEFKYSELTIGTLTLNRLRWAAVSSLDSGKGILGKDQIILQRIRRNCDQLKRTLSKLKNDPNYIKIKDKKRSEINEIDNSIMIKLEAEEATRIRKIWELGVEEVVMQTVIQLDGDVINRIQKYYAAPEYKHIHELHQANVDVSVKFWSVVVNAVATFLGSVKELFGK